MRTWLIAIIFLAGPLLLAAGAPVAAAADRPTPKASELLDEIIPKELFRHLYSEALSTLHEYIEMEGKLPGESSTHQQGGEFRLKLFPHGKSRSQEHLSAEGSFRVAPEADQPEFTLRFKSFKKASPPARTNDDVI
ncbi:MAG: hypothetical protein KF793_05240 [Nitrospira sp.]|nr:hypothetical protein [Nitrospira sp.]